MDKHHLRRQIRRARQGRAASADFPLRVAARVPDSATVCCYVALPGEPPTHDVIETLLARGCTVLLPIAGADGQMGWVDAATSRPWRAWGVPGQPPGPEAMAHLPPVDTVIVPALAVDPEGRRLGQGGGYYDRFLPSVPEARRIALLWSGEVLTDVAAEAHDQRIDEWILANG